jgi:hypothetical protein
MTYARVCKSASLLSLYGLLICAWLDYFHVISLSDIQDLLVAYSLVVSIPVAIGVGTHTIEEDRLFGLAIWSYGILAILSFFWILATSFV